MAASVEQLKQQAAERAVEQLQSGMVVGLGFGSTAAFALQRLAQKLSQGELKDILGVATGRAVEREAERLGIRLTSLERHPEIDLTIDGADEVDPRLQLVKGGGGALLREKVVAQASRRVVIVVDSSKLVERLGSRRPLPIEVLPFALGAEAAYLSSLGAEVQLRMAPDQSPQLTDQGNWIVDAQFGPIADPQSLAEKLDRRAGILAHGLFLDLATEVIAAGLEGIRHLRQVGGREGRWKSQ